jgi:hypothetical protein
MDFFQGWLFFSLLQEFLGDLYSWQKYIKWARAEDGSLTELELSTKTLHDDIAAWTSGRLTSIQKEDPYLKHLEECLAAAERAFDRIETDFPGLSELYPAEMICFASVAETLDIAVATAIEKKPAQGRKNLTSPDIEVGGVVIYLQAIGLLPSQAQNILGFLNSRVVSLLATERFMSG